MAANAIPTITGNAGTIDRSDRRRASSVTEAYARNTSRTVKTGSAKGDRLDLSEKGRLLGQAALFLNRLNAAPDVRPEAIENARQMAESGELLSRSALREAARNVKKFLDQID